MLNIFLQSDAEKLENLIVPDSVQKARFAEAVRTLADEDFVKNIWSEMANWLVWTGIKFLISLAIFYVGRWLLRKLVTLADAIMTRRGVEVSLHSFLLTAIKVLGYVFITLIIVSTLGFNSSSFIAVLASMGLAIGMALSGTLQNFAGGIMLLVLRPYRVGDYIESQDVSGTVVSINLFNTVLHTTDKKTIYVRVRKIPFVLRVSVRQPKKDLRHCVTTTLQ
jgi:small conductance mechanosensitive channel